MRVKERATQPSVLIGFRFHGSLLLELAYIGTNKTKTHRVFVITLLIDHDRKPQTAKLSLGLVCIVHCAQQCAALRGARLLLLLLLRAMR